MGFKLEGFDELEKKFNQMSRKAKEMEEQQEVPIETLLTDRFLLKHTKFTSFEDFSERDIFNRYETFEDIPQEELDAFIAENSSFESFDTLLEKAHAEYVKNQLGL